MAEAQSMGDRPMDEIEVEIVCAELRERLVESSFDVFGRVEGVPELPQVVLAEAFLMQRGDKDDLPLT